jgi:ribonuclease P protein component
VPDTVRYRFGKEDRLKSRKAIDLIFRSGTAFSHFPFRVILLMTKEGFQLQAAVSVSKRNFKKAVDRNRIKRLMREGYRLSKPALEQQLRDHEQGMQLFLLFTGKEIPDYELISSKMKTLMVRLQKLADEADQ